MHSLNTTTFELRHFVNAEDVVYAILSHRWQEEEVLFDDMPSFASCKKKGVEKVKAFCQLARKLNPCYEWVWIDTCCVDKRSSAELSEAINSMFQWYRSAHYCVVYLYELITIV